MMLFRRLQFLVICFHSVVIKTSEGRVEFTNISTKSFVSFIEVNSSISTTGSISMYVNILQDITNVYAKTEIVVQSSTGNYDLELVNKTINFCKLFSDRKYQPIARFFYQTAIKTSNFPKGCPLRKKLYFTNNYLVDPDDLPPVYPNQKVYVEVTGMTNSAQKTEPLYWFKIYVQVMQLNKSKN